MSRRCKTVKVQLPTPMGALVERATERYIHSILFVCYGTSVFQPMTRDATNRLSPPPQRATVDCGVGVVWLWSTGPDRPTIIIICLFNE